MVHIYNTKTIEDQLNEAIQYFREQNFDASDLRIAMPRVARGIWIKDHLKNSHIDQLFGIKIQDHPYPEIVVFAPMQTMINPISHIKIQLQ